MPRKLRVGPLMITFGGVVVDNVQNDLDTGGRETDRPFRGSPEHTRRDRRYRGSGMQKTDGVVTPVVFERTRVFARHRHRT